ncbi:MULTISPECIES: phospholipase D family protein [unclassified Pseudomonas]|uniref:phospholipase D family protein n=1 Tax=unclassified Pseudomonas TaxID=196821 RepID=UPI00244B93E9|nr:MULTISPECIES: phospholipase D family protein [unclassified Pseudomonas]MDG9922404.1 phospholipase D family protein [Pseudomonas sp. GD04045]MDH0034398.1 phospholipase D family protein [Pseudomonas sp. GD04019]
MNGQMSTFVAPDQYKQRLEQLLDDEHDLALAIAFWGEGALELISSRPSKSFRLLCNLKSGGTNPYVIRELCTLAKNSDGRIQILQCDRLHAKVVVGERQALIGSANVSTNGLGLGDQGVAHWLEAGVLASDETVVGSARNWFDELWKSNGVRSIRNEDIEAAAKVWTQNRRGWQLPGDPQDEFDLHSFSASDLEGLPAYVLLYRSRVSEEAVEVTEEFEAQQPESADALDWWPFESWPVNLSDEKEVDHLSIYYATNGRVIVDGVCRMIGQRLPLQYADASEGPGHIDMALAQETLLNRPFAETGRKLMAEQLQPFGRELWVAAGHGSQSDQPVRRIHIAELARVLHEQSSR